MVDTDETYNIDNAPHFEDDDALLKKKKKKWFRLALLILVSKPVLIQ